MIKGYFVRRIRKDSKTGKHRTHRALAVLGWSVSDKRGS
jgi:hypothetical protein